MRLSTLGFNISIAIFVASIEEKYDSVRQERGKLFIFDNGKMYVTSLDNVQNGLVSGSFEMELVREYRIDYTRANEMQFSALINEYFNPSKKVATYDYSDFEDEDEDDSSDAIDEDESTNVLVEDVL